jgi:hypothetical protein
MSATACWLAVLSAVGLLTAVIMTRTARRTTSSTTTSTQAQATRRILSP